jgi:hypothetical protein
MGLPAATSSGALRARRLSGALLIFIGPTAAGAPLGPATRLAELLGGRPAHTRVSLCESLEFAERRATLVTAHRQRAAAWPEHRVIVLANTEHARSSCRPKGSRPSSATPASS